MPTIRTTMRPGDEIVVSDAEYEQLLDLGLIYDGTPPVEPVDAFDTRVAQRLADSDSATRTAFDGIYTDLLDADIAPIVSNPSSSTAAALRAAVDAEAEEIVPPLVTSGLAANPTVVAAAAAAIGGVMAGVPSVTLRNLAKNPGLNADATGWGSDTTQGAVTGARVQVGSRYRWRSTWTSAGTTTGGGRIRAGASTSTMIAAAPGLHTISMAVKASRAQLGSLIVSSFNASNTQIGTDVYDGYSPLAAEIEKRLQAKVTLPAGTDHIRVQAEAAPGGAGSSVWQVGDTLEGGDVLVLAGDYPTVTYFDGGTGGAWEGTAGNSLSTGAYLLVAPSESPKFTGTPTIDGKGSILGADDIDKLFPHPRDITDMSGQLLARARARGPWAGGTRHAAGYSLTTLLGAGYTRYGGTFATRGQIPVRWITTRPTSVTIGSDTLIRNALRPTSLSEPWGMEAVVEVTGTGKALALEYHVTNAWAEIGVYIDGHLAGPGWTRDTSGAATVSALRVPLPPGVHVVKLAGRYVDILALSASTGVTLTATTYVPPQWAVTGDSWIAHGGDFGRSYSNSLAWLLAGALGVEVWNFGIGGTGYVTGGSTDKIGATARLDIVEDVHDNIAPFAHGLVVGSQNDFGTPASVQAEAAALFTALNTRLPGVKVTPVGPPTFPNSANTNPTTATTGIATAAAAASNVLAAKILAPVTEKWVTSAMWDSWFMFNVDHPTPEGLAYYVRRILTGLLRLHEDSGTALAAHDGWVA